MDFQELLINRRSIRDFRSQEVPLSVVNDIIQDTCMAPSARNSQPCQFVIIRNRDYIRKLSQESKKNLLADLQKNPDSPLQNYEAVLRDEQFNAFYNAPCLVYVAGPRNHASLDVDCALTVSYFMFSAASRGLGTCWVGLGSHIRDRRILDELGLPEDSRIIAPIILGYPAAIPEPLDRHAPDILKLIE